MKLFTDLEQSKKLAKVLPIESADMFYYCGGDVRIGGYKAMDLDFDTPCWSLAALMKMLPKGFIAMSSQHEADLYLIWVPGFIEQHISENNLVDACYEMVLRLHELKML